MHLLHRAEWSTLTLTRSISANPAASAAAFFLDQFLGGSHSFDDVLNCTPVSSRGTNLDDLATTLRSFGHNVAPIRSSAKFLKSLTSPALLAIRRGDADHFVVALHYSPTSDSFLTFDPPRTLANVSYATVASQYRGYALVVSRGADNHHRIVARWRMARTLSIVGGMMGLLGVFICRSLWRSKSKQSSCLLALLFAPTLLLSACNQRNAALTHSPSPAPVGLGQLERNMGRVVQGMPLNVEFVVCNTSLLPIDVLEVRKSCACQSVKLSKTKVILPNEKVSVAVQINTKGQTGKLSKDVVIATNSPEPSLREIRLLIQGEVVTLVRAIPSQVSFGDVDYGSTHRKTFRIEAFAPGIANSLKAVSTADESLAPTFRIINAEQIEVAIEASFADGVSGEFFSRIDLHFEHPQVKLLSVDVNANVRSRIHVVPRVVIVSAHADSWERDLRVESTDGTEFQLLSVSAPDGVVATWEKSPSKSCIIELSPQSTSRPLASGPQMLSLTTDLPGCESFRVPFVIQRTP